MCNVCVYYTNVYLLRAGLAAIHFLRLTLACRNMQAEELEKLQNEVVNKKAYNEWFGSASSAGNADPRNKHLMCNYGLWSYSQLATAVLERMSQSTATATAAPHTLLTDGQGTVKAQASASASALHILSVGAPNSPSLHVCFGYDWPVLSAVLLWH